MSTSLRGLIALMTLKEARGMYATCERCPRLAVATDQIYGTAACDHHIGPGADRHFHAPPPGVIAIHDAALAQLAAIARGEHLR